MTKILLKKQQCHFCCAHAFTLPISIEQWTESIVLISTLKHALNTNQVYGSPRKSGMSIILVGMIIMTCKHWYLPNTVKYTESPTLGIFPKPASATQANDEVPLFCSEARTTRLDVLVSSLSEDGPINIPFSLSFTSSPLILHKMVACLTVQLNVAFVPSGADIFSGSTNISCSMQGESQCSMRFNSNTIIEELPRSTLRCRGLGIEWERWQATDVRAKS